MAGYSRIFDKDAGDRVDADDFNDEYELLTAAFNPAGGHSHDGTTGNGGYVPVIADATKFNAVEVNGNLNEVVLSIDGGGFKEDQLVLRDGVLLPVTTSNVDLGSATNKFKQLHAANIYGTTLEFATGAQVNVILDEDDFASDSAIGLATQQSTKAYIDNTVLASPGIFTQAKIVRRASDQALSGAMADYLLTTITIEEQSSIVIFATVTGQAENTAGTVLARVYLDTSELGHEDTYVVNTNNLTTGEMLHGSSTIVERTIPLTAGTYTITVKLREQGTDGTALNANLLVLEEAA